MKRITLIILIMIICTGCSVNYEINLDEEIEEKVNFSLEKSDSNYDKMVEELNYNMQPILESIYDKDNLLFHREDTVSSLNVRYSNKYTLDIYKGSEIFYLCYDEVNTMRYDTTFTFETSNECNCFDEFQSLDDITIALKSEYDIISSNSDEYKDNTFYWYINKDNKNDKSIQFEIGNLKSIAKHPDDYKKFVDSFSFNANKYVPIVLLIIALIVLIFILYVYERIKKSNK